MTSAFSSNRPARLIGRSEVIRTLETEIERAARSDAKVLITGETGVGKEIVARLIHERSARVRAPLVALNCAGLPDSLLESELFGHVRGSFTGAYKDKPGLLESAGSGTVMPASLNCSSRRAACSIKLLICVNPCERSWPCRSARPRRC